jgi:hypothetical protein
MDKVERIEWQTGLFEPQNCMSLNSCFDCLCPCHAYGCLPRKAHDNEVNIGCAKDLGECECGNGCFGADQNINNALSPAAVRVAFTHR